jgi:hypothetical protein
MPLRRQCDFRSSLEESGSGCGLYAPLEKAMQASQAGYSRDELKILLDFTGRGGDYVLRRVAELNSDK